MNKYEQRIKSIREDREKYFKSLDILILQLFLNSHLIMSLYDSSTRFIIHLNIMSIVFNTIHNML